MGIPRWRLALTAAAIGVLAVAGIGLVNAGTAQPSTTATSATAGTGGTDELALDAALDAAPAVARDRAGNRGPNAGPFGRWVARHLVHAVITIEGEDGDLYTIQLDRGTVTAVDADSLTLSEAGGSSVTVALNDDVRVREGRERTNLEAIDVGDNLFVQSRVDGGTLAKRILILPAG